MRKKMVGMIFCLMIITISLQPSMAFMQKSSKFEDVEIEIYAGHLKKNIGIGISIYVLNHKLKNITCNIKIEFDYIFRDYRDWTHEFNDTIPSEKPWDIVISTGMQGIKYITIIASAEGTIVTRSGISISKIMIFTD